MKKVVVTGVGVVAPNGIGEMEFKKSLLSGKSGIKRIERFDVSLFQSQIAGEINEELGVQQYRDIKISFALKAMSEAYDSAQLNPDIILKSKNMLSIGLGLELFSMPDLLHYLKDKDYLPSDKHDRLVYVNTPADLCVHEICRQYKLTRPPVIHLSACVSSTDAIATGLSKIRSGEVDIAICGGTDSMINPMGLGGFCSLGALSKNNADPATASRPFDRTRDGFVLGEGAGFIVLESIDHATKRNAAILAEIKGHGRSLDAYSISDPHPMGEGAQLAIKKALADAQITYQDIDGINVHGTSTPKNDKMETIAIKSVFKERIDEIPVCSTKSMIGHLISAGGVVETIATILCMNDNKMHPTINLKEVDSECQLNHIIGAPINFNGRYILKNSFAFGGHNSCLVIGRY